LLHANHAVPLPELIDAVWQRQPPDVARTLLQGCISRLRRTLSGARSVIVTDPAGSSPTRPDTSSGWTRRRWTWPSSGDAPAPAFRRGSAAVRRGSRLRLVVPRRKKYLPLFQEPR
jgi:hypothetical protein